MDKTRIELFVERLHKKPIRFCRTMHHCELCGEKIMAGETYFDGGHGARAHTGCAAPRAQSRYVRRQLG